MAVMGRGLIVRTSISWIDGAGFGGCSFAGRKGMKAGGGLRRRLIARTDIKRIYVQAFTDDRYIEVYRMTLKSDLSPRSQCPSAPEEWYNHLSELARLRFSDAMLPLTHQQHDSYWSADEIYWSSQYFWFKYQRRVWISDRCQQQPLGLDR